MKIRFRNKKVLLLIFISYTIHYFFKQNTFYPLPLKYYLGDILCMPIVLSTSLFIMNVIYSKGYTRLSALQIFVATLLFSIYFELLLPFINNTFVQDPKDVFCYVIGGIGYILFFNPNQLSENKSSLA